MSYSKKEKYTGALIGAAIGDALGWPNEQNSKNISKNKNSIIIEITAQHIVPKENLSH